MLRSRLPTIVVAACIALTGTLWVSAAAAQKAAPSSFGTDDGVPAGRPYFVDFRADAASLTGHTYIVFGHLNARGQVLAIQNADVYPEDENAAVVGTLAPIRGEVRVFDGDSKRAATISYRRYLTAVEYARLLAAIRHERVTERQWSLLLFNCNDFARNIAGSLGLQKAPSLLLPATFVAVLRVLNWR